MNVDLKNLESVSLSRRGRDRFVTRILFHFDGGGEMLTVNQGMPPSGVAHELKRIARILEIRDATKTKVK